MSDGGVVVTLVAAIRQHFQDKPVVATTCGVLRHLAKSDDIKKLLMGQDTLPVLTSVLDEHKGKAEVCTQVCPLLSAADCVACYIQALNSCEIHQRSSTEGSDGKTL